MKRLCVCGELVEIGQLCPCQVARRSAAQKASDAARPSAAARGYDKDWSALRARFIAAYPICAICGEPGAHVDHIKEVRTHPHLRLDPGNLRTLCHSCHSRRTGRDHGFKRRDWNPIPREEG